MPFTVMEPVKGGALANPETKIANIFKAASPNLSYASWAIRYAASLDGVITVLSGMSNLAQMDDNLSYMKDFRPLSPEELAVIEKVQQALKEDASIKCTACRYCTDGCPMHIAIPEIFAVKNNEIKKPSWDGGKRAYSIATEGKGKASDCIACGLCESTCPQQLLVISLLKDCVKME